MNRKARHLFGALALVALLACSAFASSAAATPAWNFEETPLEGSEVILGGAEDSGMTVPGLTTTCENFLYELSIENSGGSGEGSLTDVPLYDCYTDSDACFVESAEAQELPWSTHLAEVSTTPYIVIEGVKVGIYYEGEECVLGETLVYVKGSAGGEISNETESATFNNSTLEASGTELKVGKTQVEWFGVFPTEAFQWHREEAISVS